MLETVLNTLHHTFNQENMERILNGVDKPSWNPKMITVVFDLRIGLLHIGGSQSDCKNHTLLKDKGKSIPQLWLGDEFASIIDKCCKHWKRKYTELRKQQASFQSTTQKLQDFWGINSEVYGKTPASDDSSMIFCWTISGIDFKLQSSCLHYARFYLSWEIFKTVKFETSKYLENLLGSGMSKAKDSKNFHCVKTVAAGNFYAWRNEAILLG